LDDSYISKLPLKFLYCEVLLNSATNASSFTIVLANVGTVLVVTSMLIIIC